MRHPKIEGINRIHKIWHVTIVEGQHMRGRPAGMTATEWIERTWISSHRSLTTAVITGLWSYWSHPPLTQENPFAKHQMSSNMRSTAGNEKPR